MHYCIKFISWVCLEALKQTISSIRNFTNNFVNVGIAHRLWK